MNQFTRRRNHHRQSGGIPIFAGAQGCVFKPALKCRDQPRNFNDGNISKLGLRENAENEMREYNQIKRYLKQIPNYKTYFSVQAELCEPDSLEPHDLVKFDDVCTNLTHYNMDAININANLSKLGMINMPDLGIDLKVWMEQMPFTAGRLRKLNDHISNLLIHAIGPMNQRGVIHNDLKSENVLIDIKDRSRIIDWGLAGITTPEQVIPAHHFMSNPVTFNRPFSTMVISRETRDAYSKYLKSIGTTTPTTEQIKHFTRVVYKRYTEIFDISGFNYLQYIFQSMFNVTTTAMLIDAVATYNADILYHFADPITGLNEYFSKVYRYNTDVWGLMSVFYSIFMMPRKSFIMSDAAYVDMLRRYRTLFRTEVFARGHERMNVSRIVQQLQQIGETNPKKKRVQFNLSVKPPQHNRLKRIPTPYPMNTGNPFYDRIIPLKK